MTHVFLLLPISASLFFSSVYTSRRIGGMDVRRYRRLAGGVSRHSPLTRALYRAHLTVLWNIFLIRPT